MAQKQKLSEQEKVAEILKRGKSDFDPVKAQELIALQTRCKRCGRTLGSLERVVYGDRCASCMVEETKGKRDKFVKKYIIIAFAFIAALVIGGYCAYSKDKVWQIIGTVVSSVVIGVSLVYVFYTNVDKLFPRVQPKYQVWLCFIIALVVDFILSLLIIVFKNWLVYILLMLAVAAYVAYIAYNEYVGINEKYNLIDVYNRKSRDKQYVESITEALNERALKNESGAVAPEIGESEQISEENPEEVKEDLPVVQEAELGSNCGKTDGEQQENAPEPQEEAQDSGDYFI